MEIKPQDIKDFLRLYIGCEVQVETASDTFIGKLVGVYWDQWIVGLSPMELSFQVCLHGDTYHIYKASACKLILRKLSDMTEEELKQCVANEWCSTHTFTEHYCKKKISEISASTHGLYSFLSFYGTQNSFPYLLKQGFDLFGLIPAGLAIDKTSLKN